MSFLEGGEHLGLFWSTDMVGPTASGLHCLLLHILGPALSLFFLKNRGRVLIGRLFLEGVDGTEAIKLVVNNIIFNIFSCGSVFVAYYLRWLLNGISVIAYHFKTPWKKIK